MFITSTHAFLYVSTFLFVNKKHENASYVRPNHMCQVTLSWPYKELFMPLMVTENTYRFKHPTQIIKLFGRLKVFPLNMTLNYHCVIIRVCKIIIHS